MGTHYDARSRSDSTCSPMRIEICRTPTLDFGVGTHRGCALFRKHLIFRYTFMVFLQLQVKEWVFVVVGVDVSYATSAKTEWTEGDGSESLVRDGKMIWLMSTCFLFFCMDLFAGTKKRLLSESPTPTVCAEVYEFRCRLARQSHRGGSRACETPDVGYRHGIWVEKSCSRSKPTPMDLGRDGYWLGWSARRS